MMKKILIVMVCLLLLAIPLCITSNSYKADLPFAHVEEVTSDTSTTSTADKLAKLAKDVKAKTSKNKKSSSKKGGEDSAEAIEIAAEATDATAESNDDDDKTKSSSSSSVLGNILGGVASSATSTSTISNVVGDVIGLNKVKEKNLIATWTYKEPGVAFTSESLLAEAGGEVAATACREKLVEAYEKVGITPENTSFTFDEDGSFSAQLGGHSVKGTYTFDEDAQSIVLKVLVLSLTGHTKKNLDGISLMFESQKILTLLETICKATGSKALSAVGDLSSNYDGVQVGFDLTK